MQEAAHSEPTPFSNGFDLTEAEKKALLVNGLSEIEGLVEQKDAIVSSIRTSRKRLVAHGFKSKVIDFALRLRKDDDGVEIERRREEMEVARFLNHPIGTQPDLPLDFVDRTPDVDAAFAAGDIAGSSGKTCSAPHPTGSAQEQSWIKGWHQGQATITSAFKKLEAKAAAEGDNPEQEDDHEV